MDRLDVLKLFLRVVDAGSFSQAGRSLGLGQPSVSKHIGALEGRLQTRLFRRSSRKLTLTPEGRVYHDGVKRVLRDLEAIETGILGARDVPSGTLRISVLAAFSRMYLIPQLSEFYRRYPELSLEFDISERYVNLGEEAVDVAIRVGHFSDPRLAARRIGTARVFTMAAPAYLARRGTPRTPDDLDGHDCIGFMHDGEVLHWEFRNSAGMAAYVPHGPLRSNDADHICAALVNGLGIAHLPTWLVAPHLRDGSIVRVLEEYAPGDYPINAVWSEATGASGRIAALVDFLCSVCASDPELAVA